MQEAGDRTARKTLGLNLKLIKSQHSKRPPKYKSLGSLSSERGPMAQQTDFTPSQFTHSSSPCIRMSHSVESYCLVDSGLFSMKGLISSSNPRLGPGM